MDDKHMGKGEMDNIKKVVICVCTRQRPKMLQNCVAAISRLDPVEGWPLELVIVDNNDVLMPVEQQAVLKGLCAFPVHIVHEPKMGIPMARNRALDEALAMDADWIGFMDDDDLAQEDWLVEMYSASHKYGADMMRGDVLPLAQSQTDTDTGLQSGKATIPTGTRMETAGTGSTVV